MKIVMIGNTGVGKTTYMASLYGILQQQLGGFSLQAVNQQDHRLWLDLATDIAKSRYPEKTSQRAEYDFLLQHKGKDIFAFRSHKPLLVTKLKIPPNPFLSPGYQF